MTAKVLSFLEEYIAMRNYKSQIVGFTADLVLKFSNENDIFIKFPQKTKIFRIPCSIYHYLIDFLVQYCPEKSILMQTFWSWYLMERFSE